jgi:predicted nuclease of predicted toxin-antitoxin system
MEARLLADEQFDVAVSNHLRALGHDVVTVGQLNVSKTGDGWTDEDVVNEGIRNRRIIMTDNVKDFRALAADMH